MLNLVYKRNVENRSLKHTYGGTKVFQVYLSFGKFLVKGADTDPHQNGTDPQHCQEGTSF
jgi:hypothetical protein